MAEKELMEDVVRLAWLRRALLAACGLTLLISAPLWLNTRAYPVLPLLNRFPITGQPWDRIIFAASLALLGLSFWKWRWAVPGFLIVSLFMALQDQNRWQPWFYLYWVMLLLTQLPPSAALAGNRLVLCAVYFWAGIYKCNARFHDEVVSFFYSNLIGWLPAFLLPLAKFALSITPVVEMFVAIGLWIPRWRLAALLAAGVIHLTALILLGPWGHNFNSVIWPWNLAMPAFLILVFTGSQAAPPWPALRKPAWGALVTAAFCVLPILGCYGWWDSYLCFSVYSGATDRGSILISAALKERLPAPMQRFAQPIRPGAPAGPGIPLQFDFRNWAETEIKVPPIPEKRAYLSVARYLCAWAEQPEDLRLIIEARDGQRHFYGVKDLQSPAALLKP
jgi:hypothetical protein